MLNNQVGTDVNAEGIDIKEGSCCGVVSGNTFTGPQSGQNSADSAIDIKGDGYTVDSNTIQNPLKDGIQIHKIASAGVGGCNNQVTNNHCSGLPSGGKCVDDTVGCNTVNGNGR